MTFTVGAGTGGIVALVLARRRQWSTEQADEHARHDADERRITELYTKAADQLGSDKAAVRLAGLYPPTVAFIRCNSAQYVGNPGYWKMRSSTSRA